MGAREHELYALLDTLEKSYTPGAPQYKFSHVFYNVVDGPFKRPADFAPHLWAQALLPDPTLMPVILGRAQIAERKSQQDALAARLAGTHAALNRRIDALRARREELAVRLTGVLAKYRARAHHRAQGEPVEEVFKLQADTHTREPYVIARGLEEAVQYLTSLRARLQTLSTRTREALFEADKKQLGC